MVYSLHGGKMRSGVFMLVAWLAGAAVAAAQGIGMPGPGDGMGPSPLQQHALSEPLPAAPPSMLPAPPGAGGNGTEGGEGNLTVLSPPGTLNFGAGNLGAPVTPGNSMTIPGLMAGNDTSAAPPAAGVSAGPGGFASSAMTVGGGDRRVREGWRRGRRRC